MTNFDLNVTQKMRYYFDGRQKLNEPIRYR